MTSRNALSLDFDEEIYDMNNCFSFFNSELISLLASS